MEAIKETIATTLRDDVRDETSVAAAENATAGDVGAGNNNEQRLHRELREEITTLMNSDWILRLRRIAAGLSDYEERTKTSELREKVIKVAIEETLLGVIRSVPANERVELNESAVRQIVEKLSNDKDFNRSLTIALAMTNNDDSDDDRITEIRTGMKLMAQLNASVGKKDPVSGERESL